MSKVPTTRAHVTFSKKLDEAAQRIQDRQGLTTTSDVVRISVMTMDALTEMIEKGGILRVVYADGTSDRLLFI